MTEIEPLSWDRRTFRNATERIATDRVFPQRLEERPVDVMEELGITLPQEARRTLEGKRLSEITRELDVDPFAVNVAVSIGVEVAVGILVRVVTETQIVSVEDVSALEEQVEHRVRAAGGQVSPGSS